MAREPETNPSAIRNLLFLVTFVVDYFPFLIAPPGRERLPFVVSFFYQSTAFLLALSSFFFSRSFPPKYLQLSGTEWNGRIIRVHSCKEGKLQTAPTIPGFVTDRSLFSTPWPLQFFLFSIDFSPINALSNIISPLVVRYSSTNSSSIEIEGTRKIRKQTTFERSFLPVCRSFHDHSAVFSKKTEKTFTFYVARLFGRAQTIARRTIDVRTIARFVREGYQPSKTVGTSLKYHACPFHRCNAKWLIRASFFPVDLDIYTFPYFLFRYTGKKYKIGVYHRRTGHSHRIDLPVTRSLTSESLLHTFREDLRSFSLFF